MFEVLPEAAEQGLVRAVHLSRLARFEALGRTLEINHELWSQRKYDSARFIRTLVALCSRKRDTLSWASALADFVVAGLMDQATYFVSVAATSILGLGPSPDS